MKFLKALWWLYAAAGVIAVLLIPIGAHGWLGVARDPLLAVFAILLAMPWSLLLETLPPDSPWLATLMLVAGIGLNLTLLWLIGRWIRRRR